jgi:two-component system sensor histidine kinase KdpD
MNGLGEGFKMTGKPSKEEQRPSPEDLLTMAEEEERKTRDGQLIIYLGYAAGVGKTYTMLQDALEWRKEGVDVVIGYVETHGRPETDALAARFELVPLIRTKYQGLQLVEMDTDAVIRRRPKMVLVDELAHTNAPGMRHPKRYQDIIDLIHEGISVCTTVNIQHVESLNDSVAQITGIRMAETVPDTVFTAADMIRLIDLPPEELQGRLRAGKVYVQDMAEQAIERFFSTENLLALRQIALRYVAQITDRRMITHMRARAIAGPWPAGERLLVGIRPGPTADQMVRAAYKLADRFQADWIVLSVGMENEQNLTDQEREWIEEAMETARELGGRIVRYRGGDVASEILRYARQHNVTMIMLGKPRGLDIFLSPVYRIMVQSKGIDLFLFEPKKPVSIPIRRQLPQLLSVDFAVSTVLIGLVTLTNYLLRGIISPSNLLIIQLLPVVVTALFLRRGTAIGTAIVSIIIFDIMFVEPYYTLRVSNWQYFISFIGYLVIAFIISSLATRLRYLLPQIWRSEAKAEAITALSHDLINVKGRKEIFSSLYEHMRLFGEGSYAIFVPGIGGLHIEAGDSDYPYSPKELSIAQWVYDNGRDAGTGSDTLPSGAGYYVPLKVHRVVYGVLAFVFKKPQEMLTPENKEILQTMAYLGALAIERVE